MGRCLPAGAWAVEGGAGGRRSARLGARLQLASTLSVFVSSNAGGEGAEAPLRPAEGTMLYGGYAQTKAASEALSLGSGVPVQVVRYGLLVPGRQCEDARRVGTRQECRAHVGAHALSPAYSWTTTCAFVPPTPNELTAARSIIANVDTDIMELDEAAF